MRLFFIEQVVCSLRAEDARDVKTAPVEQIDQMQPLGLCRMIRQHRHAGPLQQRSVGRRVGHADQHLRLRTKRNESKQKERQPVTPVPHYPSERP